MINNAMDYVTFAKSESFSQIECKKETSEGGSKRPLTTLKELELSASEMINCIFSVHQTECDY